MQTWTFDSPDPERTREMGIALGRSIGSEGLILALVGPLGAGKTVFVKGLAEGLGVDPRLVSSPTFVIAQEYPLPNGEGSARADEEVEPRPATLHSPATFHHIDLYRLESEDELEAIGFFDMLAPGNVLAVEWADRFPGVLGRKVLTIELEGPSASSTPIRSARVTAMGEAAERVLQDFSQRAVATPADSISAGGRGGGGRSTSPEMRILHMLCLCLLGLTSLGIGAARENGWAESFGISSSAERTGCRAGMALGSVEEDALGTLRAACVEGAQAREGRRDLNDLNDLNDLRGVGRLVSGERIDLSRASSALLQTLPGIGPARAESILAHQAQGVLRVSRDLERVPGIGRKTRLQLERWVETLESRRETMGGHGG